MGSRIVKIREGKTRYLELAVELFTGSQRPQEGDY